MPSDEAVELRAADEVFDERGGLPALWLRGVAPVVEATIPTTSRRSGAATLTPSAPTPLRWSSRARSTGARPRSSSAGTTPARPTRSSRGTPTPCSPCLWPTASPSSCSATRICDALESDDAPLRHRVGADSELVAAARKVQPYEEFEALMRSTLNIDW